MCYLESNKPLNLLNNQIHITKITICDIIFFHESIFRNTINKMTLLKCNSEWNVN